MNLTYWSHKLNYPYGRTYCNDLVLGMATLFSRGPRLHQRILKRTFWMSDFLWGALCGCEQIWSGWKCLFWKNKGRVFELQSEKLKEYQIQWVYASSLVRYVYLRKVFFLIWLYPWKVSTCQILLLGLFISSLTLHLLMKSRETRRSSLRLSWASLEAPWGFSLGSPL